ncbi:unnamed protein product, partial [Ectocarpus sp. 13 AM-2016]
MAIAAGGWAHMRSLVQQPSCCFPTVMKTAVVQGSFAVFNTAQSAAAFLSTSTASRTSFCLWPSPSSPSVLPKYFPERPVSASLSSCIMPRPSLLICSCPRSTPITSEI